MDFNVLHYGAVGDGVVNDCSAIQAAVDACSESGGRVVFPSGHVFYTSSFSVKKNIDLHIEKGAVIKAHSDIDTYIRPCSKINGEDALAFGNPVTNKPSFAFIYGYEADNLVISGEGTIDGNYEAFTYRLNDHYVTGHFYPRPTTVYLENCTDVTVRDIKLINAPFWTLHPAGCKNVIIDGIIIDHPLDVANSDGIDPDHCDNVVIKNSFIRCADDCICLKTTAGNAEYGECKNITVENCTLQSSSAAIKIGTEGIDNYRDIVFRNCKIVSSNRGISIQIRDNGNVENVLFENISVRTKVFPVEFWGTAEPIIISSVRRSDQISSGKISNVMFKNIDCSGESGIVLYCDNNEIDDIRFDSIRFSYETDIDSVSSECDLRPSFDHDFIPSAKIPVSVNNASGIVFRNSVLNCFSDKDAETLSQNGNIKFIDTVFNIAKR